MAWQALAVAGMSFIQNRQQAAANSAATRQQIEAAREGMSEQQRARLSYEDRTDPALIAGMSAAPALMQLLGIDISEFGGGYQESVEQSSIDRDFESQLEPIREQIAEAEANLQGGNSKFYNTYRDQLQQLRTQESNLLSEQARQTALNTQRSNAEQSRAPSEGEYIPVRQGSPAMLEEVNPLVSFMRDEGFQDIQESAAARGQLRSGGTLENLTEFNNNLAATVVPQLQNQRFNQLFNMLGLGANTAAGQGNAALSTANNVTGLLGNIGSAQAAGSIAQGQNNANTINDLAGALGYFQNSGAGNTNTQQINTVANPNAYGGYA